MRPCSAICAARLSSRSSVDLLQHRDRIVIALLPQHRIEIAKQADALVVPAPPQVLRKRGEPLMHRRHELPDGARLADNRRQLRAGGRQQLDVLVGEGARLARLHDEHALQHAAIDHRHAHERAKRILAGIAEVLEPRMRDRIGHDHRLHLFGHQTGQAFGDPHPDLPDAFRPQPLGRGQHEVRAIGLEQIDRADVGGKPLANQRGDVGQCFRGIAVAGDQQADLIERPERGSWSWTGSAA